MEPVASPNLADTVTTGMTPPAPTPRMPAFAVGKQAHHHSIHSALATLEALGIGAHRIAIQRTGRDAAQPGTVLGQSPAPGEALLPDTRIELRIAGLGFSHALPVGMWDSGGETHMGTREILLGFDDPLEKLKHWFHEGAPLFRLTPDDTAACRRWLNLFGVQAERWPRHLWYRLATLIAGMAQYSCSQDGCAFVLGSLLALPVGGFGYTPSFARLPDEALSGLGARASRLGVDLILGDAVEQPATLEIEIGPVTLDRYEHFTETAEGARLLRQTLEMVMPVATQYRVRWSVLDRNHAPRLGVREGNSRLGINTHMGLELGSALAMAASEAMTKSGPAATEQPL
ncbi:MAG: type VI secretion system baseplate subunit TssG [Janthinobacterium lividum]